MNVFKNIPEVVKGTLLMLAGVSLFLHTLGVLKDVVWYALVLISLALVIAGFTRIGGMKVLKGLWKKEEKIVIEPEEKD